MKGVKKYEKILKYNLIWKNGEVKFKWTYIIDNVITLNLIIPKKKYV